MTRIIFWDYDGTLVDTEIFYKKSIESYLKQSNNLLKEITNDYFFSNISGKHPEEFLSKLKADGIIKEDFEITPEELRQGYYIYFKSLKKGEIKITDDIDLLLSKFIDVENIIMCITSSSFKKDFVTKSLNVDNPILNKCFNIDKNVYLCGAIDGCKFKPEPDIFIYAFNDIKQKYNINFNENDKLFIIEDSAVGCKAGSNFKALNKDKININVVGYLGGNKVDNSKNLINNGADYIAKDIDELYKIIN